MWIAKEVDIVENHMRRSQLASALDGLGRMAKDGGLGVLGNAGEVKRLKA